MTEEQQWQRAEELYHTKGAEQKALKALQQLVEQYPNHTEGWFYLSSKAYTLKQYDLAFTAMDQVDKLDPEDIRMLETRAIKLSLLQGFTNEGQKYMDTWTKKWYTITYYPTRRDLLLELEKTYKRIISLKTNNLKDLYKWKENLVATLTHLKKFDESLALIATFSQEKYEEFNRSGGKCGLLYAKARNYEGAANYAAAVTVLERAVEVDPYDGYIPRTFLLRVHKQAGNEQKRTELLEEMLEINEKQLRAKPEMAYVSRKVSILKELDRPAALYAMIADLDLITTDNPYNRQKKAEYLAKLRTYAP